MTTQISSHGGANLRPCGVGRKFPPLYIINLIIYVKCAASLMGVFRRTQMEHLSTSGRGQTKESGVSLITGAA